MLRQTIKRFEDQRAETGSQDIKDSSDVSTSVDSTLSSSEEDTDNKAVMSKRKFEETRQEKEVSTKMIFEKLEEMSQEMKKARKTEHRTAKRVSHLEGKIEKDNNEVKVLAEKIEGLKLKNEVFVGAMVHYEKRIKDSEQKD